VIDQAVVDFSAGLMDILMELAFGQAPPGDRWKDSSARLVMLAQKLKDSPSPSWVNPPAREHGDLESLVNANLLLSMGSDSEDEKGPIPFVAFNSSSPAVPSTSASAIAPSVLQSELRKTHHSLEALTITECMSTAFFFIWHLTKSC
jgi:hypothetical protein